MMDEKKKEEAEGGDTIISCMHEALSTKRILARPCYCVQAKLVIYYETFAALPA